MKGERDRFSNFIGLSTVFHLGIFVLFMVKVFVFPSEIPIHQRSLRVDVVALPEKQLGQKQKASGEQKTIVGTKPQRTKPEKTDSKKTVEKPKKMKSSKLHSKKKESFKSKQSSAVDRLKAIKKMEKGREPKEESGKKKYKGNLLNRAQSLGGLEKLHHESYLDQLDYHIRSHWSLPGWLANSRLKARVLLLIDKNGMILNKSFVLKSGNDDFDQYVFRTLEKANPLPSPPDDLVDFYSTRGVELRFPE